jgi:hypothetical protein
VSDNTLYYGSNPRAASGRIPGVAVDPIDLDPPVNAYHTHDPLFREKAGDVSVAQIGALGCTKLGTTSRGNSTDVHEVEILARCLERRRGPSIRSV